MEEYNDATDSMEEIDTDATDDEVEHAVNVLIEAEKIKADKALMAKVRPILAETHAHMGSVVKSISDIKKARQELPDEVPAKEEESVTE